MKRFIYLLLAIMLLPSCNVFIPEDPNERVFSFRLMGTKADSPPLDELVSKIQMMLFDMEGNKVLPKIVTQNVGDNDFGKIHLSVEPGNYILVGVGHSGLATATIESTSKISFTLKDGIKITDTFVGYSTVTVAEDKKEYSVVLVRRTAKIIFKYQLEGGFDSVEKMRFKYTGGSASIDPQGYGNTKSTQTETRLKANDGIYELYTFPYQASTGLVKMTVDALDSNGNTVKSVTYDQIPVEENWETTYEGSYFNGTTGSSNFTFGFYINGNWAGSHTYNF